MARCRTCGGTGRIWSMRSWFTYDGYYSSRCGFCKGTAIVRAGVSDDPSYVKFQRTARERIAADKRWASTDAWQIGAEAGNEYAKRMVGAES